jgi:hypothetical protein
MNPRRIPQPVGGDLHMRRLGKQYLEETIAERLRDIDESDPECEVDPLVRSEFPRNKRLASTVAVLPMSLTRTSRS